MVTVRVPAQLRGLTGEQGEVEVEGTTIKEVLAALVERYPALGERIFDEQGSVRRFVNVFLDSEDIRFLDGPSTRVAAGAVVSIVPAVAGG
jgi:molybdopterin synthase sulfur carrier subunit